MKNARMELSRRDMTRLLLAGAPLLTAKDALAQSRRQQQTAPAAKTPNAKMPAGRTTIVEFLASPFPYDGRVPDRDTPFYDATKDGRRGHTSPRGGFYPESPTYTDRRVLLHIGAGFDSSKPAALVVYLHGNRATLVRDVRNRQRVPAQFDASGINGVLVAPQFALDALDSSAGHFWEPNFFTDFLNEAASRLGEMTKMSGSVFRSMPIVLVAYSGGYNPAAYALQIGGAAGRMHGVILLDALFGEHERFVNWLVNKRNDAFFISAYGPASRAQNATMKRMLAARGLGPRDGRPTVLSPGSIWFLDAGNVEHNDFVTKAWVPDPLKVLLSQIPEFRRQR
ncbi:hypothetical protein PY365_32945 [Roseiarcaceae bacterium H3SJ34-1]|uniref:hypothetical protein n=1 Tax=Terripilifer ovatus TaxID=3032367 RepID=UPI003AB990DD|nr:hypothetical protein [Roseiarcaceae bacterium H3SJ34-1]